MEPLEHPRRDISHRLTIGEKQLFVLDGLFSAQDITSLHDFLERLPYRLNDKEKWSFVGAPTTRAMVTVPVAGKPMRFDITNEIRAACEILVPPVSETMLELLSRVEPEFQEKVRHNITLAGGGSQIFGLGEVLEHALADVGGGRVQTVNDAVFAGADGSLTLALDAMDADWENLVT
jgi:rod shape-determining protein MreB